MKKKIISLLLVFFVSLSSVKFSYANNDDLVNALELESQFDDVQPLIFDGGVISGPMLATIATIAVASGIVLKDSEALYNLGSRFYDYYKDSIDTINAIFEASVVIGSTRLVKVGYDFYIKVKEFLDDLTSSTSSSSVSSIDYSTANSIVEKGFVNVYVPTKSQLEAAGGSILYSTGIYATVIGDDVNDVMSNTDIVSGEIFIDVRVSDSRRPHLGVSVYQGGKIVKGWLSSGSYGSLNTVYLYTSGDCKYFYVGGNVVLAYYSPSATSTVVGNVNSYDWNKVKDKIKDDSLTIGVPGNIGSLVGENVDVFNPTYDLPVDGVVSIPVVQNPSIALDGTTTFPNVDTGNGEDVGGGTGDITFPSFGDSLDFTPLEATGITEKFPFSLPWDIQRIIGIFDVEAKAPVFEFPIVSEKIEIDLTQFEECASIVRFFVLVSFIFSLIMISTKLKG